MADLDALLSRRELVVGAGALASGLFIPANVVAQKRTSYLEAINGDAKTKVCV